MSMSMSNESREVLSLMRDALSVDPVERGIVALALGQDAEQRIYADAIEMANELHHDRLRPNEVLCERCYHPRGRHSFAGEHCPRIVQCPKCYLGELEFPIQRHTWRQVRWSQVRCAYCGHVADAGEFHLTGPLYERAKFSPLLCQWSDAIGQCECVDCTEPMAVIEIADDGVRGAGMGYCVGHYFKAQGIYKCERR